MTLIKDLTENFDGEFKLKAARGLEMISYRRNRIIGLRERIEVMRTRINNLQAEILEIGNMDVDDLEL
uniref:Uncharacterized protein n=1 Tax=viral metagenome TaxID=1070528 RepID=A0A6M3LEJ4_9ZZZZ